MNLLIFLWQLLSVVWFWGIRDNEFSNCNPIMMWFYDWIVKRAIWEFGDQKLRLLLWLPKSETWSRRMKSSDQSILSLQGSWVLFWWITVDPSLRFNGYLMLQSCCPLPMPMTRRELYGFRVLGRISALQMVCSNLSLKVDIPTPIHTPLRYSQPCLTPLPSISNDCH